MNLPEKFQIPKERIPRAFAQGPYSDCVAITFTKILEVFNFADTEEYIYLSKGYMYGRNNRPGKTQGGSDYEYMLNTLLLRGTVPEDMCPERDEIPEIVKKLENKDNIKELDKKAEEYSIQSWEKIPGNINKFQKIKECLYKHQFPIAGNMTGRIQHCTVIIGWDGDKLLYQDHDVAGRIIKIEHKKFNEAYCLIKKEKKEEKDMVKKFKRFDTLEEFENYIKSLKVTRIIKKIQLHHTYSPSYKNFTGNNHNDLQKNMQTYHIKNNVWSDIGQHLTIFPDGIILTGRNFETQPAGIYGANENAICIECLGNFDIGGDTMTEKQKNAIAGAVRILIDKFGLNASEGITYHAWHTATGASLGTYDKQKSIKTCPGTNFFGGNTKEAYNKNLKPLIENYGKEDKEMKSLKSVESINDIIWELANAKIITDCDLWAKKCNDDINVYWLCRKMANKLRGTL